MDPEGIQSIPLRDFTEEVISIRDARKKYCSVVLDGLNMTVPKGAIYGLLGPSGCGKTTILNCITGRTELDSGTIDVKVSKLEQLGYMPQALCLLSGLTIMENFYFHGYLYYMNNARIKYRGANLILFLDLPSKNTLISDLSGGEQRRVSLATALFHDPQLLILDEPTVGLDPILSHSIWERLKSMSNNGTTILITTHYVQDAYSSDVVGLMRDGVLVAEHKPNELLGKFNSNNLEDVFLQLSFKQSKIKTLCEDKKPMKDENKKPFKVHFENDQKLLTAAKFKGLVYKTLTLLKRSYLIQLTVIILPFLNTFLFNAAIGRTPKGLSMAVVNDEVPLEDCKDVSKYNTCLLNENGTVFLSCLFLDIIKNKSYNFVEYDHLSKAVEGVKKNEVWAMLHFTKNFTTAMASRFNEDLTTDANIEYMISNSIESRLDMSNQYIGSFITYDLTRSMTSFLEQIMQICDLNPKLGSLPIRFEKPIYGNVDENFITYSSAALICVYCFVLPSVWSCTQMFLDKTDGILERTLVTGASMFDVCTSIFAVQLVTHVIQTAVSMYVMYVMFENPMYGSLFIVCILMLLTGTAGIFYGMILGLLFDSVTMLGAASTGTIITLTLVTGLIWPTEGAHYLIRILRWFIPLTWTVDATRALSLKAFPIHHPIIINGFLAAIFLNVTSAVFIYFIPMLKKTVIFKNR